MHDLAKRAVACKAWRWMPGMLTVDDGRVLSFDPHMYSDDADDIWDFRVSVIQGPYIENIGIDDLIPDLKDAATLGCLLALVREVYGDTGLHTVCDPDTRRWLVWSITNGLVGEGDSEAEALVSALESSH